MNKVRYRPLLAILIVIASLYAENGWAQVNQVNKNALSEAIAAEKDRAEREKAYLEAIVRAKEESKIARTRATFDYLEAKKECKTDTAAADEEINSCIKQAKTTKKKAVVDAKLTEKKARAVAKAILDDVE